MRRDRRRYRQCDERRHPTNCNCPRCILEAYYASAEGILSKQDATTLGDELRDGPRTVSQLASECGLSKNRTRAGLVTARLLHLARVEIAGKPRWARRAHG